MGRFVGEYVGLVAAPTEDDEAFAEQVRQRGHPTFGGRDAQYLREKGVLPLSKGGDRGKRTRYTSECTEVADAIEQAKDDPEYKRKFHRAVLIAWANDAPVGTGALRQAFKLEHRRELDKARQSVRDRRPSGSSAIFPEAARQDRRSYHQAVDDLFSGESPTPAARGALVRLLAPLVAESLHVLASDYERLSALGDAVGAVSELLPAVGDIVAAAPGLVTSLEALPAPGAPKEGDGPSADDLATTAERFVRYFLATTAETSGAAAARYAPRADLDHARDLARRLRDLGFLPIGPSALDLAMAVSDWLAFQHNYDPKPRATRAGNPPSSPKVTP